MKINSEAVTSCFRRDSRQRRKGSGRSRVATTAEIGRLAVTASLRRFDDDVTAAVRFNA